LAAAREATEHLISMGRSRIAAISVHTDTDGVGPAQRRLEGEPCRASSTGALPAPMS